MFRSTDSLSVHLKHCVRDTNRIFGQQMRKFYAVEEQLDRFLIGNFLMKRILIDAGCFQSSA